MAEKVRQEGFFISADAGTLRRKAEEGDKKIKPKHKKEKKQKSDTLAPKDEIRQFHKVINKRAKILEPYGVYEDSDGSFHKFIDGKWSLMSHGFVSELLKEVRLDNPEFPAIPALSATARWLMNKIEKRKMERGPLRAPPLPHADKFDAFGNPLK